MSPSQTLRLACLAIAISTIAAAYQSPISATEVLAGRESLSVLSGPAAQALSTNDFEARLSGPTLLIATRPAPQHIWAVMGEARESDPTAWRTARCLILDHGPEMPGSLLPAPPDSAALIIDKRNFPKTGPVWLGYLFSTNGSYLALFSTDARRLHRSQQSQTWMGEERALEPQGQVFVDIYRTQDQTRVAAGKYRFTQGAAGSLAFWLDSRILVVPAGPDALLGVFPALPPQPTPASLSAAHSAKSSCIENPATVRILSLRDQGVDDDRNGKFEGVKLIANITGALPGLTTFAFQLDNGRGKTIESDETTQLLETGPNEVSAFVPANTWRTGGASYQLTGIRFAPGPNSRVAPFTAVPGRELRTQVRPAATFDAPGSHYAPNTAKITALDANQDGLFDRLLVEIDFYSEWEGPCNLSTFLSDASNPYGFDHSGWSGDIKRGRNQARFYFDARNFITHLRPQPFYLNGAQTECESNSLSGPTSPPIKLPIIDFSRFKDAHCLGDLNNDGVVDDADLKISIAQMAKSRPVEPGGELYKDLVKIYESSRGCRVK